MSDIYNPPPDINAAVNSVSNSDGTITVSPTTGAVVVSLAKNGGVGTPYNCTTTLDWNNGVRQYITLANNGQTFTFANPKDGQTYQLLLTQPSSGAAGTVTWPGTVDWGAIGAPTLTITNSKSDLITLTYWATLSKYVAGYNLGF